jgi:protein-S-isoprenylcysteine O-methyltransferase Ste14
MSKLITKNTPAILFYLSAVLIIAVIFMVDIRFAAINMALDSLGLFLIYLGIIIILWAFLYMRLAVFALIEARRNELVTGGPYRFIRHPVYTGTIAAILGLAIVFKSWPGIIGVAAIFIPSAIYRAHAEDKALERKFGVKWQDYATHTGSLLPTFKRPLK